MLLTEVGHPGSSGSQGHQDLLVGEVEWQRQLTQHRYPAVGLGDKLSTGLSYKSDDQPSSDLTSSPRTLR